MAPGVDAGDTAWMLAATALVLLMTPALGLFYAGPRALQEHAQHVHDVRRRAGGGDDHVGADRLLARVRGRQRLHRRLRARVPERRRLRAARRGRRSRTCSSSPSRRRSASSPPRWSRAPWSSGCASAPFLVFTRCGRCSSTRVLAHWAWGGGWLQAQGTLDFAGGVPVEMGSGFSALAAALVVGARKDYGRQALLPAQRRLRAARRRAAVVRLVRLQRRQRLLGRQRRACSRSSTRCWRRPARWRPGSCSTCSASRQVTAIGAATAIVVGCVGITPAGGLHQPDVGDGARRRWRRSRATR